MTSPQMLLQLYENLQPPTGDEHNSTKTVYTKNARILLYASNTLPGHSYYAYCITKKQTKISNLLRLIHNIPIR